jgi:hypothetical protein
MEQVNNYSEAAKAVGALGAAGLVVGLGQLLASEERLTRRIIVGRAMSSAGLGAASAGVLAWIPDLPLVAQLGIACAMASLGTSGLEKLFQRITGVSTR